MIRCLHCGAETNNGLALCELCQRAAATCLEFIPIYFGNLARWRPGRAGSRPVPGSREPQGAFSDGTEGNRVERCLDETGNDLVTRVRQLVDDRGVEVPYAADSTNTVRVACWLLGEYLTSISTLDWCGDLVADLQRIETTLRRFTEQVVPGWYAGACASCRASTYVVPGLTWVTCSTCGLTTYARDHLEVILDEARGWVARPKRIAETLVALIDTELSVARLYDRIRQWAAREEIQTVRHIRRGYIWNLEAERFVVADEEVGHARYRLGEVLDLLEREGTTRGRSPIRAKSATA